MNNKRNTENRLSNEEKQPIQYALNKGNYLLILLSLVLIIVGFVLMMGEGSTDTFYNPDIFSTRRIVIAPTITFIGFVCIIFAILYRPKKD
ncbi:MAG: DUF3098 domain-containing protein [Bacteroidaceae bacterium]|nr:DUF3098 domain-containing protein [Bacteroidaceae bacterium]